MKLSTFTRSKIVSQTSARDRGAVGAYRLVVSTAYKHNALGLGGFRFGGKLANDIYIEGVPAVEYVSTFRVLANMYHGDRVGVRVVRRSLKQLGWVYSNVSLGNRPQMFDTVGLSYRSIFGFARRIFLVSPKFQHLRRTAASKKSIIENRLFSTPFVQYRRVHRGLPANQSRKKWRDFVFIGGFWRAIQKLRKLQSYKDRDAWWQSSWTRAYKTRLKPTRRSHMADLTYIRMWFNRAFMRAIAPQGTVLRTYTNWNHARPHDKGKNWLTPIYLDRRDRNRRFPRTWRKTRRYVRLKSERTAWINDAAGYNYRSPRSFVGLKAGTTFDGSYSQLTFVAGTRSILYVPARLAIRRMFNTVEFMRKWRRIERRGFRKALRFYRKFDRSAVFLPKVPRNPVTGAFSIAPRLGYARLSRIVSVSRADFRAAKVFKVRNAGEWFYRIGSVARTLFYKRLRSWAGGGSSTRAVMKLRRYCGMESDSWSGIALGYFKHQVARPTQRSKNYRDFRIALKNVMSLNYPGFFIERNLTRFTTYDLAFFNPNIDVSYVRDHYLQWTSEQKTLKIHRLMPGQAFPRVCDVHNSFRLSDRRNRQYLGRKLGFVDKFLAYAILNTKSSAGVKAATPYRRTLAKAVTQTPVSVVSDFGDTRAMRRDNFYTSKLAAERSLDWNQMSFSEGISTTPAEAATPTARSSGVTFLDSSRVSRRLTRTSRWIPTAFGLKRVAEQSFGKLGTLLAVTNPVLVTTRTSLAKVTPSRGLKRFKDRYRSHGISVWALRRPVLFGTGSVVATPNSKRHARRVVRVVSGFGQTVRKVVRVADLFKSRLSRLVYKTGRLSLSFGIHTLDNRVIGGVVNYVLKSRRKRRLSATRFSYLRGVDFFKRYFLSARVRRNASAVVAEPLKTYLDGSENPVLDMFGERIDREMQSQRTLGYGRLYLDSFKAKWGKAKPQPKHLPQKSNKKLNAVLSVFGDDQERKQSRKERRRDFFKNHQQKSHATNRSQNWRAKNHGAPASENNNTRPTKKVAQGGRRYSQNKKN